MTKNSLALTIAAIAFTATASSAFASTPTVDVDQSNVTDFVFSAPVETTGDQANTQMSAILHSTKGGKGHGGYGGRNDSSQRGDRNNLYRYKHGQGKYSYNRKKRRNDTFESNNTNQTSGPSLLGLIFGGKF